MTTAVAHTLNDAERARMTEADTLAATGDGGLEQLLAMLTDPSWAVRRHVVARLAQGGRPAVLRLCAVLRSQRDHEARIAAAVDALVASSEDADDAVAALAEDSNPAVVADVAQILGRRRSARSVPLLVRLLAHPDDNVAVGALEALGRIGGRAAVDSLIRTVRSGSFFRVFPAIDVLGRSGDPRAVEPLADLLDDPHYAMEAARALGRTGDKAAVEPLLRMMARQSEANLRTAALALVDLMERYRDRYGVIAPVEDVLRRAPDAEALARRVRETLTVAEPAEQAALCTLLASLGGDSSVHALTSLLDGAPVAARAAAAALQRLSQDASEEVLTSLKEGNSARRIVLLPLMRRASAAPSVQACLQDPDPQVRALACDTLAQLGHVASVPSLFTLLQDTNPRVVQAATAAIQSLGSAGTEALALQAARSTSSSVRKAALRILSYFGYGSALPIFLHAVAGPDQSERDTAIQGLPFLDDPGAVDALMEAARDPAPRTRASAFRAMANLVSDPRSTAFLLKALSDEDPWCRYYAAQSLGKLHCEVAAAPIARLLDDPAGQVRVAALEALTRLQSDIGWRAIERAAESTDPDVQRAALIGIGLGQQRRPESLSILLRAASSPDATTRLVAVGALGNSGTPQALRALARAALDPDENVRLAAIAALGSQADAEATVLLADLLRESTAREQIMHALSTRNAGRITGLLSALDTADDELAPFLTSALARMHRVDGNAALVRAMSSPNAAARRAAATTLAALGTRDALGAIRRAATQDPDPDVRRICAMLMGR